MENNITLFNITDNIIELIDTKKNNILLCKNIEKQKKDIQNSKIIIVDLEQKLKFKTLFENIKNINENISILGLINFNRSRIATKLLKDNLSDYIIKDDIEQLKNINQKIEQIISNSQKKINEIKKNSMIEFINSSVEIKKIMENIIKISNADIPILIHGEEGCEHNLYAETIHNFSNKKNKPFLNIFCPNINRENIENILYGTEREPGKLEKANDGTIFFEDVDLLDLNVQSILARILENGEVDGIDSSKKNFDVRILFSSTKDLEEEVKNGNFNRELYLFINGYTLDIPPLRKMKSAIPLLVKNLYKSNSIEQNKIITGITNKALKILENYEWPGNIKEMKNIIRKAIILNKNGILEEEDFINLKNKNIPENEEENNANDNIYSINLLDNNNVLKNIKTLEKEIIDKYMTINNGNISETAKYLNLGRSTLYRKMEEYNN